MDTRIAGVRIDRVGMEEAVERAAGWQEDGVCRVFTPNIGMIGAARRDKGAAALLNTADLSLPDGIGVVLVSRFTGRPISERVAGIDFGYALMQRIARTGGSVFLLGAKPGVAEKAGNHLARKIPGLVIAGTAHGYFGPDEEPAILARIAAARPTVLFVCMGFPRQERWIVSHTDELSAAGVRVAAGLGGSLDVWSGNVKRAPLLFQRLGLEWLWRIARRKRDARGSLWQKSPS